MSTEYREYSEDKEHNSEESQVQPTVKIFRLVEPPLYQPQTNSIVKLFEKYAQKNNITVITKLVKADTKNEQ